jgi:hypothetical protein
MKTEAQIPEFHKSFPATCLYTPNKEVVMGKGRERRFTTLLGQAVGRGKVSPSVCFQPSSGYTLKL